MKNFSLALSATALLGACSLPGIAAAQTAPVGLVRIVSTFPTGSGPDVLSRMIATKLSARWGGQPVIVDPRPGAAGVSAINAMKKLPATGNDLVVVDVGNMAIYPLTFKNLAYDTEKELTPVALLYKTAFFVAVAANSPIKNMADLKKAAATPGQLTYGSNAVGGVIHLSSARLASAMGVEMLHVPYKELTQLYTSVSTSELSWSFGSIATAGPLMRSDKLRFIAVADKTRAPALPNVPTVEEAGGPKGMEALSWVAIMAPAGTPANIVNEINVGINDAIAQPDIKAMLATSGFYASPGPALQVTEMTKQDRARFVEVLKTVKVQVD